MKQRGKLRVKWALKNISPGLVIQWHPSPFFRVANRKKENAEKRKSFKAETIKRCHQCQNVAVLKVSRIQNF